VLRFACPHCSVKLTAREDRAGRKVLCPHCKGKIALPLLTPEPAAPEPRSDIHLIDPPKRLDGDLLQLKEEPPPTEGEPDEQQREEALRSSTFGPSEPEYTGQRQLPWPVDILLYPFSMGGLTTLAIVIVIPLVINLVAGVLGPFGFFIRIPGFFVIVVIQAYFLWYIPQCIQDSALGGVRAPETVSQAPGLWDMNVQLARTLACMAVATLPVMIYSITTQRVDETFWLLLAFAAVICPMALLSVTMHDSIGGLNPLILIPSVLRTLPSYTILVLVLGSMVFLAVRIGLVLGEDPGLSFAFRIAMYHPILVAAHLLGRFYWRKKQKLDWFV
jgi:DNA-directed RNA polymerase subunit RPC12/RpoP